MRTPSEFRQLFFFVCFALLFVVETALGDGAESGDFEFKVANGILFVELESPIVWTFPGKPAHSSGFCQCKLKTPSATLYAENDFFDVGGQPLRLTVKALDSKVEIVDSPTIDDFYVFKEPGTSALSVQLGNESFKVEFEIREFPYVAGSDAKSIIEKEGFPSFKESHYVGWPDTEKIDGIVYDPEPTIPDVFEHWQFAKFKYAVLSVRAEKLTSIHGFKKREIVFDPAPIEQMPGPAPQLSAEELAEAKAELAAAELAIELISAGLDVPQDAELAELKLMKELFSLGRDTDVEKALLTITDKTGKFTVEAIVLEVSDGTALLLKKDATKVKIPLSKLSDKCRRQLVEIGREHRKTRPSR